MSCWTEELCFKKRALAVRNNENLNVSYMECVKKQIHKENGKCPDCLWFLHLTFMHISQFLFWTRIDADGFVCVEKEKAHFENIILLSVFIM